MVARRLIPLVSRSSGTALCSFITKLASTDAYARSTAEIMGLRERSYRRSARAQQALRGVKKKKKKRRPYGPPRPPRRDNGNLAVTRSGATTFRGAQKGQRTEFSLQTFLGPQRHCCCPHARRRVWGALVVYKHAACIYVSRVDDRRFCGRASMSLSPTGTNTGEQNCVTNNI